MSDYRATIAAARQKRDVAIAEAKAEWRATAAAAAAERDSEIRRLRAEGVALTDVALAVGVSPGLAYEVLLSPERRLLTMRAGVTIGGGTVGT